MEAPGNLPNRRSPPGGAARMHKALRKTPIWYHNLAWMLGEMGSPQANQSQAGCPALVKK